MVRADVGILAIALRRRIFVAATVASITASCATAPSESPWYEVVRDTIPAPLTSTPGDAARGRELISATREANCLLCHTVSGVGARSESNVGPPLAGVGARLSAGQLRLRIVDPTLVNHEAIMPPYFRTENLDRVAAPFRGKPVLTAQQIEDIVAYLQTLR